MLLAYPARLKRASMQKTRAGSRTLGFAVATAEALVDLVDPGGLTEFEEMIKLVEGRTSIQTLIRNFHEQLKKEVETKPRQPGS